MNIVRLCKNSFRPPFYTTKFRIQIPLYVYKRQKNMPEKIVFGHAAVDQPRAAAPLTAYTFSRANTRGYRGSGGKPPAFSAISSPCTPHGGRRSPLCCLLVTFPSLAHRMANESLHMLFADDLSSPCAPSGGHASSSLAMHSPFPCKCMRYRGSKKQTSSFQRCFLPMRTA